MMPSQGHGVIPVIYLCAGLHRFQQWQVHVSSPQPAACLKALKHTSTGHYAYAATPDL